MTTRAVVPGPAADDRRVVVPLRYGLCAVYVLREKPSLPPAPEPWKEGDPPPWGPVGYPD